MRPALFLAALAILLAGCVQTTEYRHPGGPPGAAEVEMVVRHHLADRTADRPGVFPDRHTHLTRFRLLDLDRVGPGHWVARVLLGFDHGPPPRGVVGYQRFREGPYLVDMARHGGGGWQVLRFHALGKVRPLPGPR
ncbi:MAG: hypothetical protein H6907_14780 [Hyphomicrobiales bacterium]|nr:hypothetical protein [Hyphomicrobiales bacterium]MCP5372989.1 hypothetical protein [Hyphomicrobiales bacterium]